MHSNSLRRINPLNSSVLFIFFLPADTMAPKKTVRSQVQRPNRKHLPIKARGSQAGEKRRFPNPKTRNDYSRDHDCWNCGMKDHKKDRCPMPSTLKCSFCQTVGVRSDQCSCRKRRKPKTVTKKVNNRFFQEKVETCIFVKIYGKTVRAFLNPSVQETIICEAVATLVKAKTGKDSKKLILRSQGTVKMVYYVKVKMNTRAKNEITVDGIINPNLTEKVIILGMLAIKELGFKFFVGGQEAKAHIRKCPVTAQKGSNTRNAARSNRRRQREADDNRRNDEGDNDDDRMSFLDEEEARRIRDWDY